MRITLLVVALAHVAYCGVNIQMPYASPAGVTFVDGSIHSGLHAGSLAYTTATARPYYAAAPVAAAPVAYTTATARPYLASGYPYAAVSAPVAYGVKAYQTPAVAYHAPAVAYQPVTKYAAVPTVHHVHGHADVPVTRYEAHPAVIQKAVDVAKPAIKTRKYEIRRPAIQKQFYDVEERTIVREAGSALLELEQPLSKSQKGDAVISPAAYAAVPYVQKYAVPAVHSVHSVAALPAYARLQPFGYSHIAAAPAHYKLFQTQLATAQPISSGQREPSQPEPTQPPQQEESEQPQSQYPSEEQNQSSQAPSSAPQAQQDQPQSDDDDSVSVENPEFSGRSAAPEASEQESAANEAQPSSAPAPETSEEPQARPMPEARSAGVAPLSYSSSLYDLIPQGRSGPSVVPSLRNLGPEVSQANQQRLIQLLTANGGVTEVGLGRSGPVGSPVGESGQIRGRVLSATPAPPSAEPTGERVNTRRVVISRPIETIQEIEVQEPITKLERIHVNHPTFIKTARQELVRVPTSHAVVGKAYAPVAHAAIPVAHHAVPSYSTYYG